MHKRVVIFFFFSFICAGRRVLILYIQGVNASVSEDNGLCSRVYQLGLTNYNNREIKIYVGANIKINKC